MRGIIRPLILAGIICLLALPSFGASWTKVGDSSFTTSPALMQDWFQPVLNSVVVDSSGNVYATANNGSNKYNSGGFTIFKTDNSKINVDLKALGLPGGITKLVKGGDGKIYACQNWREHFGNMINGGGSVGNIRQYNGDGVERILQIESNGSVNVIYSADQAFDGWRQDGAGSTTAITVGSDYCWQMVDTSTTDWRRMYQLITAPAYTAGARFKIDSYTLDPLMSTCLMEVRPRPYAYCPTTVTFGIYLVSDGVGGAHLWLGNAAYNVSGNLKEMLVDLGAVDTTNFHTAYLYVDSTTNQVKVRYDGTDFSYTLTDLAKVNKAQWFINGHVQFGASTSGGWGGTTTVTFDWVGGAPKDVIATAGPWSAYWDGSPTDAAHGNFTGVPQQWNNRVSGMAVGADGNVYWLTSATNGYWKYHYVWKYNVATGVAAETSLAGTNVGGSQVHGWNCFEYVGDGKFTEQWENAASWLPWCIEPNNDPTTQPFKTQGKYVINGGGPWGREYITAAAWDAARNKFWQIGTPYSGGYTWKEELGSGATRSSVMVDLGGGNKGIELTTTAGKGEAYALYPYNDLATPVRDFTVATRFKLENINNIDGFYVLRARGDSLPKPAIGGDTQWYTADTFVGVIYDGGVPRYKAWTILPTATRGYVTDLGPVDSNFHTVYVHIGGKQGEVDMPSVTVWWDGVKMLDQTLAAADRNSGGSNTFITIGDSSAWWNAGVLGDAKITLDYMNVSPGNITPSDTPAWDYACDLSQWPQVQYQTMSNIATLSSGIAWGTGLFGAFVAGPAYEIARSQHFHMNNNNPQVVADKRPGYYWGTALAVNPADGKAWMSWAGEPNYTSVMSDVGAVKTRDINLTYGDEGVPEAGAQVVGLTFDNGTAYATTCNMTTGVYSLYKATVGAAPGTQNVAQMRSDGIGTIVETDSAKLVTWPNAAAGAVATSFYIQDDTGLAGIKVNLGTTLTSNFQGDKVTVKGILNVVNGELCITEPIVTTVSTGNPDIKPVATNTRNVGGNARGGQPATSPAYGLTNVGTLVKVAGKVGAVVIDDMSGVYYFTIDDGSGAVTKYLDTSKVEQTVPGLKFVVSDPNYFMFPSFPPLAVGDKVGVVGVCGLDPSYAYTYNLLNYTYGVAGQRVLLARDANDIQSF